MKKIIIILVTAAGIIFPQEKLFTLEESLETGLANSKNIKIAQSMLEKSRAKADETYSNIFPELTFSAAYMRLSDVKPFEVNIPFAPQPITISEPLLDNYQLKLSLKQPLFTGFRLTSLNSAAEYNTEAESFELQSEKNEEAYRIMEAFWNVYRAERNMKVIKENEERIKAHLEDTKNYLDAGLITKSELLKLEVQLSTIQLKAIEAENMNAAALANFNRVIGLPLKEDTGINAGQLETDTIDVTLDEVTNEALENRNELKSLTMRINAGEEIVSASSSAWYPQVFLNANFYYSNPNPRIMPAEAKFYDTWDAGVSLVWSIWDWGGRSAKTEQAEQTVLQLETNKQKLEEAVELEVYRNYLALTAAYKSVKVSRTALEQAEEHLRNIEENYKVQMATSTDLTDAQTEVLEAETSLVNAIVNFKLSKARLEKSAGRIIY